MSAADLREAAECFRDAQAAIEPLQVGNFNAGALSRLKTLHVQLGDWAEKFDELADKKEAKP